MEIRCKNCRYTYDYKVYGERCPQCHFENRPFRSQAARRLMDYSDDSFRNYRLNHNREERREEFLRSGDPDYGKSPLRRVRRYVMLLAICFGVLALGQAFTRLANLANAPEASLEKPPISALADASFQGASFHPVGGVNLQVRYTGSLPDALLGKRQRGKVLCVFVDVAASLEAEAPDRFPGSVFVRAEGKAYPAQSPRGDGADLSQYTPLQFGELRRSAYAAGQLFFYLPPGTETFDLCWQDQQQDTEQRMTLHL